MQKLLRRTIYSVIIFVLAMLCFGMASVYADSDSIVFNTSDSEAAININSATVDEKDYFFLPSGLDSSSADIPDNLKDDYTFMHSSNIPSLHFFSKDPENKGMSYIHSDKENKAAGEIYLCDSKFSLCYHGDVDAFKGRGNSTWAHTDKKPYQIKLSKKADLIDPADGEQKAKKWILLANAYDPTLIRNTLIYYFARRFGITNTPDCIPVDFYYDGNYRGSYLLCEKVEVGSGRVEMEEDPDEQVEEANPGVDFDELKEATSIYESDKRLHYIKGLNNPKDIDTGFLLEIDHVYGNMEKSWFEYNDNEFVTSKQPEYATEDMMKYISMLFLQMYDYVTGQAKSFSSGLRLQDYIDIDSFARYFIICELFDIEDAWVSSTYLYKPKDMEIFYAGPVWDCDSSMRLTHDDNLAEGWFRAQISIKLLQLPEFRKAVKQIYESEIRDIVFNELLGGDSGYIYVQRLRNKIRDSIEMNYMIWDINDCIGYCYPKSTVSENYFDMIEWIQNRVSWFDSAIMDDGFVSNKVSLPKAPTFKTKAYKSGKTIKLSLSNGKYILSNVAREKTKTTKVYQIAYRRSGTKKWKVKKLSGKKTYKITKLKHKKVYQIKVRALTEIKGHTYRSPWSHIKKVKTR